MENLNRISKEEMDAKEKAEAVSAQIEETVTSRFLDEEDAREQNKIESSYLNEFHNEEGSKFKDYNEYLSHKNKEKEKETRASTDKLIDGILKHDEENIRNNKGAGLEDKKIEPEEKTEEPTKKQSTQTEKTPSAEINQKEIERSEEPAPAKKNLEKLGAFIETTNTNFFGKMSSAAKKIMSHAYDGIYLIPGVNKVIGKMEIAYNQFWIDRKENETADLKKKMDVVTLQKNSLEDAQRQIKETSKMLEEEGFSGSSAILSKMKKIEKRNFNLKNEENNLQSKIEKRENRIKLYTNKRDAIADRLIGHYDKKLSPIENNLEVLKDRKNKVELFCSATEVRLDEQHAKIKRLEESKKKIEKSYMDAGLTERKIRRDEVIKEFESQINEAYTYIQIEKRKIALKRHEINEKIAKVDRKADPYRNKRDQFVRVKDRRPVDFKIKERKYSDEFKSREEVNSHTRSYGEDRFYDNSREDSLDENTRQSESFDDDYEKMERLHDLMDNFNIKVGEITTDKKFIIDQGEFKNATGLSAYSRMNSDNFKKIVRLFYKAKNINEPECEKIITNFN